MTRLTAAELEITQAEYDALIWVRDAIDPKIDDTKLPRWMKFDMDKWGGVKSDEKLSCGTNCCIGSSMELHMAGLTKFDGRHVLTEAEQNAAEYALKKVSGWAQGSPALNALFFHYIGVDNRRPAATAAIDRFLAGNTQDPWLRHA